MIKKSKELHQALEATPCSWVLGPLRLFGQSGLVFLGLQTMVEKAAYSGTGLAGPLFSSFTLRGGRFLSIKQSLFSSLLGYKHLQQGSPVGFL